ncbi:MAG TPA: PAC2 family protein [Candidatus Margulisiibacteriota bacterium]|nr:PAC2 family protein [Candidatus Margulisiibacteriota bacterium]
MEGVKIVKRPKLRDPYLIVAWPGMGEVAFKAANYLIEQLSAEAFAEIPPEEFFYLTGSFIHEGNLSLPQLPYSKFYYWKNKKGKNDIIIFISSAQPDLAKAQDYSERIIRLARSFDVKVIVSFASMPQPIDHTQTPQVWFAATSNDLKDGLSKHGLNLLLESQISGMNGLFLGIAKNAGFKGFCLLGEIPFYTIQLENPRASQAVLEALARIINIQLDLSALAEQSRSVEGEINKFLEYLKSGPQGPSPIGEEEIEGIKKTLNQLTKLPISVKDNIERLFEQTKFDITKANELKRELDKWNVYKEYEDRFLDLFRKTKEKGN